MAVSLSPSHTIYEARTFSAAGGQVDSPGTLFSSAATLAWLETSEIISKLEEL